MQTILPIEHIASNPDVRGGRPCIVGTGLRVIDIVMAHIFHDQNVDQLAAAYNLPVAKIYAALAYYYDHKAELDADIRDQIETGRRLKEEWIANGGTPLLSR